MSQGFIEDHNNNKNNEEEEDDFLQFVEESTQHTLLNKCSTFLKSLAGEQVAAAVLNVDMVGSTKMSFFLSSMELERIVKLFWHEMSLAIESNDGLVFKYVGDAVIGIFPQCKNVACSHAIECALEMVKRVQDTINPGLIKDTVPAMGIKIGLDYGKSLAVYNGDSVDLIGFNISMASKICSLAGPNTVMVGQSMFDIISQYEKLAGGFRFSLYHNLRLARLENNLKHTVYRIYSGIF